MCDIAIKSKVDKISVIVIVLHVKDRNDDDYIVSISVDVQVSEIFVCSGRTPSVIGWL